MFGEAKPLKGPHGDGTVWSCGSTNSTGRKNQGVLDPFRQEQNKAEHKVVKLPERNLKHLLIKKYFNPQLQRAL